MSSVDRGDEQGAVTGPDRRVAGTPTGDRQLLRAAALGEEEAWGALVDAYAGTVWSTCLRCGLRADEAAAVSRLVWMNLLDVVPHLDVPLDTWLVATATHEAHQALGRSAGGWGLTRDRDRRAVRRA